MLVLGQKYSSLFIKIIDLEVNQCIKGDMIKTLVLNVGMEDLCNKLVHLEVGSNTLAY